jgi:hypothetical protein
LTNKIDSLVKFLEEERAARKSAEFEVQVRNKKIVELELYQKIENDKYLKIQEDAKAF